MDQADFVWSAIDAIIRLGSNELPPSGGIPTSLERDRYSETIRWP
jgi:hypothetical protein